MTQMGADYFEGLTESSSQIEGKEESVAIPCPISNMLIISCL
jgi:hypothetical protein